MKYGVLLVLATGALGFAAARLFLLGGVAVALAIPVAWLALSSLVVAIGYLGLGPRVFGKRGDGTRAPWAYLLVGPFLVVAQIIRRVQLRLLGENPWDEVAPGVYVGRLVRADELPDDVVSVIDMTAEFLEDPAIRERFDYYCLPTLDGTALSLGSLLEFARIVVAAEGPLYVHCAAGHGRSSMVASIVLVTRELGPDVRAVEALMKKARPRVHIGRAQHRAAQQVLDSHSDPP